MLKKNKNIIVTILMTVVFSMSSIPGVVQAHSGRTDSNGGHRDNKNASGLGSYHYHHGYPAHLHTNGCPYSGGSASTSSSGTSSSSNKNSNYSASNIQKEKQSAKSKGYNEGYSDGYKEASVNDNSYLGSYKEEYKAGYEEGYAKGKEKIEAEKSEAYNIGKELGKSGAESKNEYTELSLKASYDKGYKDGYKEYKEEKIKEYSKLGEKDGKEDNEINNLEGIVDNDIKEAYIKAYNKEQEILKENYIEEGKKFALEGNEYIAPKYDKEKFVKWFKEGYDNGADELEKIKLSSYEMGYTGKEFELEDKYEPAREICLAEYDKGAEKAKEEQRKNIAIALGTLALGGGAFYVFKKKS